MTKYTISISYIEIIMNLIRIQNEQLLKIISNEEDIDYELLKHLLNTPLKIKQIVDDLS